MEEVVKIAETDFPMFREAFLAIPGRSLASVPEKTLKERYREFLKRLEASTSRYTSAQLKAMDPKELINKF